MEALGMMLKISVLIILFSLTSQAYINNGSTSSGGSGLTSLNSQIGSSQVFSNDTNITVTSSDNTHALGWSGTLSLARGGTGAALTAANGDIVYSSASKFVLLAAGTSGQFLSSTGAGAPSWSVPTDTGITSLNSQVGLIQVFANDTNFTITSSNNTHTLGWSSTLSIARGGTGNTSYTSGSIPYSNGSILTQNNADLFWDGTNMRIGIGMAAPQGKIHLGSSAFPNTTSGTIGTDAIILGYVNATANIGNNAVVLGGANSGSKQTASGAQSVALGGITNIASGSAAIASGSSCTASGNQSFSGGTQSLAQGTQSFAWGFGSSGANSARAAGIASVAMGSDVAATGLQSFAANKATVANGDYSTAHGNGTKAQAFGQFTVGLFNIIQGSNGGGIATVAGDDLFIVGNGVDTNNRSNAFSVTYEGMARSPIATYPPIATQVLGAGFSIDPSRTYTPVSSASAVSSDTSVVITTTFGSSVNVEPGQTIIIQNKNASDTITLKSGGNAKLPGAADLVLGTNDTATLIFDGTNWITIANSNN